MVEIIWTSPAFRVLEGLPQAIAFGIVHQTDHLRAFPEMGSRLFGAFESHEKYRQLIFRRRFRTIYEFVKVKNCVYILNVQNCRQKLPTARQLKKSSFRR